MDFHSTLVSHDCAVWPEWFRGKYAGDIRFNYDPLTPHSYLMGTQLNERDFIELHTDVQRAIDWDVYCDGGPECSFIFLLIHDCGGVTRCRVSKNDIVWSEPIHWKRTEGITHDDCCHVPLCKDDIDYDARPYDLDCTEDE